MDDPDDFDPPELDGAFGPEQEHYLRDFDCICMECGEPFVYSYPAVICGRCNYQTACEREDNEGDVLRDGQ